MADDNKYVDQETGCLLPGHPRYVKCVAQFNEKVQHFQPQGIVWVTKCFKCGDPLHLSYDPNDVKHSNVSGFAHRECWGN